MAVARIAGYVEERWSLAALWSHRLAVFALVLGLVALMARWIGVLDTLPFLWVLALVAALALVALLCAAAGFQRVWHFGDRGAGSLALGVVIGLIVLAPFGLAAALALTHPALADITTDLDDPPPLEAASAFRTGEMNALAPPTPEQRADQMRAYPTLTGRRYAVPYDRIVVAVEAAMRERGWAMVSPLPLSDVETNVEAIAFLPVLALPYDVAVRITDEGVDTYVDMRSASRYGERDMGVNANIIDTFLTDLDAVAAALAGGATPAAP